MSSSRVLDAIRSFGKARVVVVGDLILDEYVEGQVRRISPEAPVQIVSVERTFFRLGGAANVANQTRTLGARTRLTGSVGRDDAAATLKTLLDEAGIEQGSLVELEDRPTTRKLRVLAQHQQLIRLDWERVAPGGEAVERAAEQACDGLERGDAIVVSDYGKGVVSRGAMTRLIGVAKANDVPVIVDPKSRDFGVYAGATVLTPNLRELEEAYGHALGDAPTEELARVAMRLIDEHGFAGMIVTLGHRGLLVVEKGGSTTAIEASAREVFDVTGAGDTVTAVLALGLARGLRLADAAAIANTAAGIVVGKLGTAVVGPDDLIHGLLPPASGPVPQSAFGMKVLARAELGAAVRALRAAGKRIVFTNGCFDLLHPGHLVTLRAAASFGDALIVGINSDASVKRLKGDSRPVIGERDRAELVAALECVAAAVVFEEDTPLTLIEEIVPDVLVKGADYKLEAVVGREIVEKHGGRVELVALRPGYSTTKLIGA